MLSLVVVPVTFLRVALQSVCVVQLVAASSLSLNEPDEQAVQNDAVLPFLAV